MKVARTIAEIRELLEPVRTASEIGLVPTMGALHAGHLALIEAARAECDPVVASIFVNPTQFGPGEGLDWYPRNEEQDVKTAEQAGVDYLFVPSVDEMYPEGFQTWVEVEELSKGLEGAVRPGHFRGVATVCLKLFNIVRPKRAYFGLKDAQQAAVVERLVRDLDLDIQIRLVPTVRDDDGLALSSRNAFLDTHSRDAARALPRAMLAAEEAYREGADPVAAASSVLRKESRLDPEYVELAWLNGRLHLVAAVRASGTHLIDNVLLRGEKK
jgi:pantoate--beta-alanine ligase